MNLRGEYESLGFTDVELLVEPIDLGGVFRLLEFEKCLALYVHSFLWVRGPRQFTFHRRRHEHAIEELREDRQSYLSRPTIENRASSRHHRRTQIRAFRLENRRR